MAKSKELAVRPSDAALAELKNSFPVEAGFTRNLLPRLSMVSQDVVEGKGKTMKVVTEAGTFFSEVQGKEEDENGKKVWNREEIGKNIEGIIVYQRKQLKFYDSAEETYTSSPVYDSNEEVIPLFKDKVEVDRGTPDELRSRKEYQGVSAKGKPTSKLEENRILYVLYKDSVHQLNLRGSSMYSFLSYSKKILPPSVLTSFGSEEKTSGSISWNQMTFSVAKELNADEIAGVQEKVNEIRQGIKDEKSFYLAKTETSAPQEKANQVF